MSVILGLDVSTSCTGFCVIESGASAGDHYMLDRIEFKKCKTLWEKTDVVQRAFKVISAELSAQYHICIDRVVVEEPLMGFRAGMSSAQTISTLIRFNGITSYIARDVFGVDPEYIGAAHARKLCGVKLQKTAIGGPQKEQVFSYMSEHDLHDVKWPVTKTGKQVLWSRDATDAYVIARAAAICGPIVVTKKPKKVPKPPGGCAYPCEPGCPGKPMKGLTMCRKHQPFPA